MARDRPYRYPGGERSVVAVQKHTIANLRLNLKEAEAGRTWLILPEGFRAQEFGQTYPLPSSRLELQVLAAIPIPPGYDKKDSGTLYLRRAFRAWKESRRRKNVKTLMDLARREYQVRRSCDNFEQMTRKLRAQAREELETVKVEAAKAVASLSDLFSLAKQGLDAQMRAHLGGTEWNGEKIGSRAFRECARIVLAGVKGLGLPSEDRNRAKDAIIEEAASAIRATQEAVDLAPGAQNQTEH